MIDIDIWEQSKPMTICRSPGRVAVHVQRSPPESVDRIGRSLSRFGVEGLGNRPKSWTGSREDSPLQTPGLSPRQRCADSVPRGALNCAGFLAPYLDPPHAGGCSPAPGEQRLLRLPTLLGPSRRLKSNASCGQIGGGHGTAQQTRRWPASLPAPCCPRTRGSTRPSDRS